MTYSFLRILSRGRARGTLTQLEMFQNPFNVLGRALRHTSSLGVLCWLEVIDLDHFLGFLFLAPHVWSLLLRWVAASQVLWTSRRRVGFIRKPTHRLGGNFTFALEGMDEVEVRHGS